MPNDRLWVRETFCAFDVGRVHYRADYSEHSKSEREHGVAWTPSIHMPRWASRITLEITAVRVERLQDISEADAMAEGIVSANDGNGYQLADTTHYAPSARDSFFSLWESINGDGAVEKNPWVWVVEFKQVKP